MSFVCYLTCDNRTLFSIDISKEEDVGYVDLWDSVVGKEGMYARDGLHLSGKGAAVS